jgi:hypothetical protein
MSQKSDKVAEVIEASTAQFTAQCYELYEVPALGSLVKTGDIYGIVCHAETAGIEPGRKPIAQGPGRNIGRSGLPVQPPAFKAFAQRVYGGGGGL